MTPFGRLAVDAAGSGGDAVRVTMWEALAAPGRGAELAEWVRREEPPGSRVYRSADDRVVLIAPAPLALADVPGDLLARPPHAWDFEELTDDAPSA